MMKGNAKVQIAYLNVKNMDIYISLNLQKGKKNKFVHA